MSVLGIKSSLKKLKKEAQPKKKKQRLWNKILGIMAKEKFDIAKKKYKTLSATQRSEVWALTVKEAQAQYKVISDARKVARNEQKERGALLRRQRAEARYAKERRESKKKIFNIASQHHSDLVGTLKQEIERLNGLISGEKPVKQEQKTSEILIKPETTVKPETQKTGEEPETRVIGVKSLNPSAYSDDPRSMVDTSTSYTSTSSSAPPAKKQKQQQTTKSEGTK